MKILKMFSKLILCLSISIYGLPTFANVTSSPSKVELTDSAMSLAVGGSMHAQILSTPKPKSDGNVKALVAVSNNFGCCEFVYFLEVIDTEGTVIRTIAKGPIYGNQALVISGQGLSTDQIYRARVDFSNGSIPGLAAVDTEWTEFR